MDWTEIEKKNGLIPENTDFSKKLFSLGPENMDTDSKVARIYKFTKCVFLSPVQSTPHLGVCRIVVTFSPGNFNHN